MKSAVRFFIGLGFLTLLGCSDEGVIAKVDGHEITQSTFDTYLKFKRIPQQNTEAVNATLDDYIERETLAAAIDKTALLEKDLVEVEIQEFRKQLLISRYMEKYLEESVSEQALQNYYSTHPEEFATRKVRVAHILIRTNSAATEVERQAQMTRAHEAYSKINSGEDFAKVAENYSQDEQSAKRGGDLGWITENAVDPKFSTAAFALEKDQVSEPVATSFGFHVIKVLEAPQSVQQPFEQVKGDIRYRLRQQAKDAETQRLRTSVKTSRS